jgi:hypothetical protein
VVDGSQSGTVSGDGEAGDFAEGEGMSRITDSVEIVNISVTCPVFVFVLNK